MTASGMKGRHPKVSSMTGFGRAVRQTAIGGIAVELKSTNHRFLEIEARLPNGLSVLQSRVSEVLRSFVQRGRIEASISLQLAEHHRRRIAFDEKLLERYHRALVELKARFGLKGAVSLEHLLALPQAFSVVEERLPAEQLWEPLRQALILAAEDLVRSRRREGAKLIADLNKQLKAIDRHVRAIMGRLPKALAFQRKRLKQQLQTLLGPKASTSTSVLEQAVALVKDVDVNEELVRLESHLTYVQQTLRSGQPVGKRLDFIAQELMREANTTGAKVDDPVAAQHVVEIKGCIEKIREQVQNLE